MIFLVQVADKIKHIQRVYEIDATRISDAEMKARQQMARELDRPLAYIKTIKTFGPYQDPEENMFSFIITGAERDQIYHGVVEQFCDELRIYLNDFGDPIDPDGLVITLNVEDVDPCVHILETKTVLKAPKKG